MPIRFVLEFWMTIELLEHYNTMQGFWEFTMSNKSDGNSSLNIEDRAIWKWNISNAIKCEWDACWIVGEARGRVANHIWLLA